MIAGGSSIDGVVSNTDTLNGGDSVGGVGSLGLEPVVGGVSSAVSVVPGVVGDNGVPESVVSGSVGENGPHEAGGEVGLEEPGVEVDPDEVGGRVVVLKVEALQVTVVPGEVKGRTILGDDFLCSVPVLVVLHQAALSDSKEKNAKDDELHKIYLYGVRLSSHI